MKSCLHCPDRTVEPNCHTGCEHYIAMMKQRDHINHIRAIESAIMVYNAPKIIKNAIAKSYK